MNLVFILGLLITVLAAMVLGIIIHMLYLVYGKDKDDDDAY